VLPGNQQLPTLPTVRVIFSFSALPGLCLLMPGTLIDQDWHFTLRSVKVGSCFYCPNSFHFLSQRRILQKQSLRKHILQPCNAQTVHHHSQRLSPIRHHQKLNCCSTWIPMYIQWFRLSLQCPLQIPGPNVFTMPSLHVRRSSSLTTITNHMYFMFRAYSAFEVYLSHR
jgi:hypothetical protein